MTKIRPGNMRNWKTGVIHAATPRWETYEEIPHATRISYSEEVCFHKTLCGAEIKGVSTFAPDGSYIMSSYNVNCKRCLKVLESKRVK